MRHQPDAAPTDFTVLYGVFGLLGTLLLLALTTAVVIYLVQRGRGRVRGVQDLARFPSAAAAAAPAQRSALEALDVRLARGEIEVDDYLGRRAALLSDPHTQTAWRPSPLDVADPMPDRPVENRV